MGCHIYSSRIALPSPLVSKLVWSQCARSNKMHVRLDVPVVCVQMQVLSQMPTLEHGQHAFGDVDHRVDDICAF